MKNMERIIKNRNRQLLQQHVGVTDPQPSRPCNCRPGDRANCPLQGKCQMKGVVYKATVSSPSTSEEWFYIGLTANTFKTRYATSAPTLSDTEQTLSYLRKCGN